MMEQTISVLQSPGALALVALVVFASAKLIGAFRSDHYRKKLLKLCRDMMSEADFNASDKAWMKQAINSAVKSNITIVAIFAPLAVIMAIIVGLFDSATKTAATYAFKNENELLRQKIDDLNALSIQLSEDIDPRQGHFWADPRRKEINRLSDTAELWNSPLATLWVFFWMGLAAPFFLVGVLIKGSGSPFIKNLWEPIRSLVPAFTRTVDKLNLFAHR